MTTCDWERSMWDVWVHHVKLFPHLHVAVASYAQEHFPGVLSKHRLPIGKDVLKLGAIGRAFLGM